MVARCRVRRELPCAVRGRGNGARSAWGGLRGCRPNLSSHFVGPMTSDEAGSGGGVSERIGMTTSDDRDLVQALHALWRILVEGQIVAAPLTPGDSWGEPGPADLRCQGVVLAPLEKSVLTPPGLCVETAFPLATSVYRRWRPKGLEKSRVYLLLSWTCGFVNSLSESTQKSEVVGPTESVLSSVFIGPMWSDEMRRAGTAVISCEAINGGGPGVSVARPLSDRPGGRSSASAGSPRAVPRRFCRMLSGR